MIKYRFYRSKNENLKVFNLQVLVDEKFELYENWAAQNVLEKAFFDAVCDILENRLFLQKSSKKRWMETLEIYEDAQGSTIQLVDDQFDSLMLEGADEELINKVHQMLLETPLKVPKSSIKKYKPSMSLATDKDGKHKITYVVNADPGNKEIYSQKSKIAASAFVEDAASVIEKNLRLKKSNMKPDSARTIALFETAQNTIIEIMYDESGGVKIECIDRYALEDILSLLSDTKWRRWS